MIDDDRFDVENEPKYPMCRRRFGLISVDYENMCLVKEKKCLHINGKHEYRWLPWYTQTGDILQLKHVTNVCNIYEWQTCPIA